jgi:hypothetical protein
LGAIELLLRPAKLFLGAGNSVGVAEVAAIGPQITNIASYYLVLVPDSPECNSETTVLIIITTK